MGWQPAISYRNARIEKMKRKALFGSISHGTLRSADLIEAFARERRRLRE
jgi:hypothetical protein